MRTNIAAIRDQYKKAIAMTALIRACTKKRPRGIFTYTGDRYNDGRKDLQKLLELPFIDADNREQLERILELDNEETIQVNFTSLSESVLEKLYEQRNEFTGPVPKL